MGEQTLKTKAYEIIKNKIVRCQLMPGDFLDEKKLMEEIGSSRTPIREALNKLEQENLISIIPKKGVVVCNITIKDVVDVYAVREVLEPLIIRRYGHLMDKKVIEEFEKAFKEFSEDNYERTIEIDKEMHKYIVDICGNKYLSSMFCEISAQNDRIRIISGKVSDRLKGSIQEHLNVICYLKEDNYDAAAEEMYKHIENAKKVAIDSFMIGRIERNN